MSPWLLVLVFGLASLAVVVYCVILTAGALWEWRKAKREVQDLLLHDLCDAVNGEPIRGGCSVRVGAAEGVTEETAP